MTPAPGAASPAPRPRWGPSPPSTVAAIAVLPGLVDVGFLGWMAFPFGLRLAFHLPLLTTTTAALLAVLLAVGAVRHLVDDSDPPARRSTRGRSGRPRGAARVLAPRGLGVLKFRCPPHERQRPRSHAGEVRQDVHGERPTLRVAGPDSLWQ